MQELSKLKIHTDPWENYLYYDSKFLLDMVFNKNFKFIDEIYVLTQFFIFMQLNDISGNFIGEGRKIAQLLSEYLKKQGVYQEVLNSSRKLICSNVQLNEGEANKFDSYLEDLFSEFIENLKQSGNFNEIKQDYFVE